MDGLAFGIGQQLGGWGSLAGAVFCLVFYLYHDVYKAEPSRANIVRHLRYDAPGAFYRAVLTGRLRWLDQRLSPREMALPDDTPGKAVAVAWSHGLLNLALLLALAYPILSLMARWTLTGQGDIAGFPVFPEKTPGWLRGATIGGLALGASLTSLYSRNRTVLAVTVTVTVALAVAFSGAYAAVLAAALAISGLVVAGFVVGVTSFVAFEGARPPSRPRSRIPSRIWVRIRIRIRRCRCIRSRTRTRTRTRTRRCSRS